MAKKKVIRKYKPLPPHSDEAHPIAHAGEINKPFMIAIIAFLALIILSSLIFFGSDFVGKAIATEPSTAGIVLPEETINIHQPFSVPIYANIGSDETVAVSFRLQSSNALFNCDNPVTSPLESANEWGTQFTRETKCPKNDLFFEIATINYKAAESGYFKVADINFLATEQNSNTFTFTDFSVLDLSDSNNNLVTLPDPLTLSMQALACESIGQEGCTQGGETVSGISLLCENNICITSECSLAIEQIEQVEIERIAEVEVNTGVEGSLDINIYCETSMECMDDEICTSEIYGGTNSVCVDETYGTILEDIRTACNPQPNFCSFLYLFTGGLCIEGEGDCYVYDENDEVDVGNNMLCAGNLVCLLSENADYSEEIGICTKVGPDTPPPQQPAAQPQRSGGGGGRYCWPNWKCGSWSYCNNELQQTKTCRDLNGCEKPKIETQACLSCDESWICSEWSSCTGNAQQRTCYDEHACGTMALKPTLTKSCTQPATGPAPARVQSPPLKDYFPPVIQNPESFYTKYKSLIIGTGLGLLALVIIILLIIFLTKHKKHLVYNFTELEDWIKKERELGTNDQDIRQILAEHTGWTNQEIDKAFNELTSSSRPNVVNQGNLMDGK